MSARIFLTPPDPEAPTPVRSMAEDEVHVWTASVASTPWDLACLDAPEYARLQCLRRRSDQRRFLAGRALARTVLAAYLDCSPDRVRFGYTAHGRPLLTEPERGLDFNLSHAGRIVALVVGSGRCGVDVERVRELPDLEALAASVLPPDERADWHRMEATERFQTFFQRWVLLEAWGKADGRGLGIISVGGTAEQAGLAQADWRAAQWAPEVGHELAVVARAAGEGVVNRVRWLRGWPA